jgi:hypothetical protein
MSLRKWLRNLLLLTQIKDQHVIKFYSLR